MTATQALHLIEQFASQSPFSILVTDMRGVVIYANRKHHETFEIQERPSGILGVNVFDDSAIAALRLEKLRDRAKSGELLDEIVEIPDAAVMRGSRKGLLVLRAVVYPLRSPAQKIEHFVIILNDITSSHQKRMKLRAQIRDVEIYRSSEGTRMRKHEELEKEIAKLEKEIRALGADPA